MHCPDCSSLAGAFAVIGLFGAIAALAAVLLLRDLIRAETGVAELEAEIEHLHDRVFDLADSEERFRSLVEAQGELIVRRDATGRITFANEGFARLMGAAREDVVGAQRWPPVKDARLVRLSDTGVRAIDEAVESDGKLRWIAWLETTIATGGGLEVQRVGRDVTDRMAVERALEGERAKAEAANEAKSRFLATVSHEIRTPLNGILGMAKLLADTGLDPEQSTYARALKTSGEALLSLIDGILDFSRIEAGRLDLAAEAFDLHALVEGVVELLAPRAQGKGMEIASSIAADAPRRVVGDGDRIRQVLMNLAGNAVKFTDAGGVGVSVKRGRDGRLVFSVADTGPGIAPERLSAIFQEFEQGDGTASRRHEGTGLGLSISRRIVERMGGTIIVESALGAGSTFSFALALAAAEDGDAPISPAPDLRGRRVLIVARSPFEAPFLAARLTEAKAIVAHHTSIDMAESALAETGADVVIADCALGDDAVRRLAAAARRAGAGRALVLLSPFERREFGPPAEAGFDDYLVKPVRPRSLFARLLPPGGESSRPSPGPDVESGGDKRPCGRGLRVLLAEDNEINAMLALKALERLGATADWARNGAEAVGLVEASLAGGRARYDLALMDIRMPELDGLTATRRIRALERAQGLPALRIVAVTANCFAEDREAARGAGFDGFLGKPFDRDKLALLFDAAPAVGAAG